MLKEILESRNFELDKEQLKSRLEKIAEDMKIRLNEIEYAQLTTSKSFVKYILNIKNKFYIAMFTEDEKEDFVKEIKFEKIK